MGKAGRIACIATPYLLSLAALICLGLIFAGQTNEDIAISRNVYFMKTNSKGFDPEGGNVVDKIKDKIPGKVTDKIELDNKLLQALQGVANADNMKDFYQVGLFNYCEGDIDDKGNEKITHCSEKKANFWFNPIDVWKLKDTAAQKVFDDKLKSGLDAYAKVAKWMFTAYAIAMALTVAELLFAIAAIFSRWGSFVVTIISTAQTFFYLGAAITSSVMYGSLVAVFKTTLSQYKIQAFMGNRMMAIVWIGAAFSIASGFFWLISICCCSGKSPHKKTIVEKTPYTYERVASPYLGAQQGGAQHSGHIPANHGPSGTAYEPFRHDARV